MNILDFLSLPKSELEEYIGERIGKLTRGAQSIIRYENHLQAVRALEITDLYPTNGKVFKGRSDINALEYDAPNIPYHTEYQLNFYNTTWKDKDPASWSVFYTVIRIRYDIKTKRITLCEARLSRDLPMINFDSPADYIKMRYGIL